MKYIIDLPENRPLVFMDGERFNVVKPEGREITIFERGGVNAAKLAPYDESEVEQRGADKAWELFKKLDAMSADEWMECFEQKYIPGCFGDMSYTEVKAKYDAWQKRKSRIRVGDEVRSKDEPEDVMVFTGTDEPDYASGIKSNGRAVLRRMNNIEKTGRHFSEVTDLLEKMKESE